MALLVLLGVAVIFQPMTLRETEYNDNTVAVTALVTRKSISTMTEKSLPEGVVIIMEGAKNVVWNSCFLPLDAYSRAA